MPALRLHRYASFLLALMLCLVGAAGTAQAQYASIDPGQVYNSDEQRYGHLQYFGFYASAMESWNFTEELAGFTNLTWIHVGSAADEPGSIAEMIRRLGQAKDAGVQAVLSIEPFLFKNSKGVPREDSELEGFLVELRAQLEFAGLFDTLLMLYPKDEPFREFVNARDPNFYEQYVSGDVYKDVHRDLERVNAAIRLVFPEKPIGVILSGYEIFHKFFSIPENFDWVGFDCYDNLFKACDDKSFVQTYRHLLDHMQPQQKLMAVPETWATNENLYNTEWPKVLTSRLRHHYEIALSEPRFIAFVPFLWSFDADVETPGLGLNRFGELYDLGQEQPGADFVELVEDIGLQIKLGEQRYPNMAWEETEDHTSRPLSSVRGEVMGISRSGILSAWAIDDALPHKSLRVRVLVRNGAGQVVHKSGFLRTNVDDPGLRSSPYVGKAFVGLHGFRYELPASLIKGNQMLAVDSPETSSPLADLTVEWLVYGDGSGEGGMSSWLMQAYAVPMPSYDRLHSPGELLVPTLAPLVEKPVKMPDQPFLGPNAGVFGWQNLEPVDP